MAKCGKFKSRDPMAMDLSTLASHMAEHADCNWRITNATIERDRAAESIVKELIDIGAVECFSINWRAVSRLLSHQESTS